MYSIDLQDLGWVLALDIVLVVACVAFALRQFQLSFAHPYFFYLFYHIYTVTYRLYAVLVGQPTMYEMEVVFGFLPISYDEIMRAALWYDSALILFTLAAVIAEWRYKKKSNVRIARKERPLDKRTVTLVCAATLMLGIPMFAVVRGQANVGLGTFGQTSYAGLMSNWPIVSILSLIYVYGFSVYLVVPGLFFLGVNALQGYHRVMTVIPILFCILIHLQRKNRNWPNITFVVLLIALFAVFPVLKRIGRAYQQGEIDTVKQLATDSAKSSLKLSAEYAPSFLDQFACTLTLADELGKTYYGVSYAYLFVYWVPRALWPDKPSITTFMFDLATPERPIAAEGRIVTYLGDAYVNYGTLGLVLYPVIVSFFLTMWYCYARKANYLSIRKYFYIVMVVGLLQVYRDGLTSLIMFGIVHNMPALLVLMAHIVTRRKDVNILRSQPMHQISIGAWKAMPNRAREGFQFDR